MDNLLWWAILMGFVIFGIRFAWRRDLENTFLKGYGYKDKIFYIRKFCKFHHPKLNVMDFIDDNIREEFDMDFKKFEAQMPDLSKI